MVVARIRENSTIAYTDIGGAPGERVGIHLYLREEKASLSEGSGAINLGGLYPIFKKRGYKSCFADFKVAITLNKGERRTLQGAGTLRAGEDITLPPRMIT